MLLALWHKSETSTKNVIQLKLFGVHKSMLTQLDHYDSMAVVGGGGGGSACRWLFSNYQKFVMLQLVKFELCKYMALMVDS